MQVGLPHGNFLSVFKWRSESVPQNEPLYLRKKKPFEILLRFINFSTDVTNSVIGAFKHLYIFKMVDQG